MSNTEARANDPDLRLLKMCQELTDKVTALEEERKSLSNQNVQLAFKVGDLDKQRQALAAERDTLLADKNRLREEHAALEARAQEAAERARAVEAESQKTLADKIRQLQDEMKRELEAQAARLGSEFSQNKDKLGLELEGALEKARALSATVEEHEAEAGRLRSRAEELQSELTRHEDRARKESERAEGLSNELATVRAEREAEGANLRTKLEEREKEVAELEATVRAFKEQFLEKAQTSLSPSRKRKAAVDSARPREVLRYLAEETLGSTGRILVDSIFGRLGHDPDTTDGAQLQEVVEQLLDYSGSLATPEQYESLKAAMEKFQGYLERPEESVELLPAIASVEDDDDDLEEPLPAPAAPVRAAEPPTAAPPLPAPPVPEPETIRAAEPEPAPIHEDAPVVESMNEAVPVPPPAVEAPAPAPVLEPEPADIEELPLPPAEAEALVRLEDEEVPGDLPALTRASDPAVLARIEEGMKLLAHEKFEQSLDLFVALHAEHPNCLEVQMGMFYNYVGFDCYMEAYEFGLRLMPVLLASEGRDRFVTAMSSVLKMRLEQTRNLAEKKAWLLQLAELHLDKPQVALKYLRQAQRMPDEIPGDGRISFYLTRLLADTREERMPYLHTYMSRVSDSREVFRHIHEIYSVPKHRALQPGMELVLALAHNSRADAQALQDKFAHFRVPLEAGLLEQAGTASERALLELMLDKLVPAAKISLDFPSPRQQERIAQSQPAPGGWGPAVVAEELRQALFAGKGTVTVLRYEGSEDFLTDLSPDQDNWTLILHQRAEELPVDDLKFYILRRYFQAQRRHLQLYRIQEALTDESRRALLRKILEGGPDITHSLQREADKLLDQAQEITVGQWRSLLDRLYTHARHEDFRLLFRLFTEDYPFAERLSAAADQFAARVVGLATACYALTRELAPDALARVEAGGLQVLYEEPLKTHRELRLRVQRLWLAALKPA